mmetsp:Transcript_56992/g.144659  ORF Transcript_56992/g.144659 Transcript_56992/m.144659 type:complete len:256 (+) Transcript_56992:302-1069(+)
MDPLPHANKSAWSRLMMSAPFSATMTVGAFVLPEVTTGNMEASQTRNPSTSRTRNDGSTTTAGSSGCPILHVPLPCQPCIVFARTYSRMSSSVFTSGCSGVVSLKRPAAHNSLHFLKAATCTSKSEGSSQKRWSMIGASIGLLLRRRTCPRLFGCATDEQSVMPGAGLAATTPGAPGLASQDWLQTSLSNKRGKGMIWMSGPPSTRVPATVEKAETSPKTLDMNPLRWRVYCPTASAGGGPQKPCSSSKEPPTTR